MFVSFLFVIFDGKVFGIFLHASRRMKLVLLMIAFVLYPTAYPYRQKVAPASEVFVQRLSHS